MSERVCWLVFTLMSCALITLATTLMGYINLDSDSDPMVDITRNWETKTILDIQVSLSQCPDGYQNIYNSKWPGTMSGCWCGDISDSMRSRYRLWSDLYASYCDSNKTRAGCTRIDQTPSIPMDIWSTINGTKTTLCVQRSTESWLDVADYSGNTCPPGKIKCGSSVDNTFCASQGSKCPINDIQMSSLLLPRDSEQLSQCNSLNNCVIFAQDSSTAQILKYQRGDTFDALPTAQFRLNEYGMCKDSTQDNVTPGRPIFALLKSKSNCGQEGDTFWNKTMYQVSENKLFDWNGVSPTIQYLNQYGYYGQGHSGDDYQYNLYSRSYIPWKMECRDQMNFLVQKNDALSNLKKTQFTFMFLSCFTGVILTAVLPMFITITTCIERCEKKEKNSMARVIRIIAICVHFCIRTGFLFFLQIPSFRITKDLVGIYSSLIQRGCSTSEVTNILNTMEKSIDIAHYGNIISMAWFGFTTLVYFCFFVLDKMKDHKAQLLDRLEDSGLQTKYHNSEGSQFSGYDSQQYSQPKSYEMKYSQPRDYEIQYSHMTNIYQQQQQPIIQPLLCAPPAPLEDELSSAKPLYEPFDHKNYTTQS